MAPARNASQPRDRSRAWVAVPRVCRASITEGRAVSRSPAPNRVRVEGRHYVSVDSVDVETVADIDIARLPEVTLAVVGTVDDVAIASNTDHGEVLGSSRSHVVEHACVAVTED